MATVPRHLFSRPTSTADLIALYGLRDSPLLPDERVERAPARFTASTPVQRAAVASLASQALCPACGDNVVSLLSEHYNTHHPDVHKGVTR